MSLFKTRNFWQLDLGAIIANLDPNGQSGDGQTNEDSSSEAASASRQNNFSISSGCFHAVGPHELIVCGSLTGLLLLIQVPSSVQTKLKLPNKHNQDVQNELGKKESDGNSEKRSPEEQEQQILAAKQVEFPINDLRCGFFGSSLEQSVAVLTNEKLLLFRIKRNNQQLSVVEGLSNQAESGILDGILGYRFEERHRFDLLPSPEIAISLLAFNRVGQRYSSHKQAQQASDGGASFKSAKNQLGQQRDSIVVSYANQFLFSIIDQKKLVGHFCLKLKDLKFNYNDQQLNSLANFLGPSPKAFAQDSKVSSLLIALSNNFIYSVSWRKIVSQAKQNVLKLVAKNLFQNDQQKTSETDSSDFTGSTLPVELDLDELADWKFEALHSPLDLISVSRRLSIESASTSSVQMQRQQTESQTLLMSRYNLDLISSSGQHLWSYKFERPLACLNCYVLPQCDTTNKRDKLMSLICVGGLADDQCNLLILEDNQMLWSTRLDSKPQAFFRLNLTHLQATLILLQANGTHLEACYLGSNAPHEDQELELEQDKGKASSHLDQLAFLDYTIESELDFEKSSVTTIDDDEVFSKPQLDVRIQLEAENEWPDVQVNCSIEIRPIEGSRRIIRNLVALLEFDDAIEFRESKRVTIGHPNHIPDKRKYSNSLIQLSLGSCWPDRRNSINIQAFFKLRQSGSSASQRELIADRELGESQQVDLASQTAANMADSPPSGMIIPNSLLVRLYLRFNLNDDHNQTKTIVQEENFLLPLNLVANLAQIDYSLSSSDQDLLDYQTNLSASSYRPNNGKTEPLVGAPNYTSDLCIRLEQRESLVHILDSILELDLICRNGAKMRGLESKKSSICEKIDLLAQSLNCRLRYSNLKKQNSTSSDVDIDGQKQVREQEDNIAIASIAFEFLLPTEGSIDALDKIVDPSNSTILWLHLCDLTSDQSHKIPRELINRRLIEWKYFESSEKPTTKEAHKLGGASIIISIESDHELPVWLVHNHLIARVKTISNIRPFRRLDEFTHDKIEIDLGQLMEFDFSFVAISLNMHEKLVEGERQRNKIKLEVINLKSQIDLNLRNFSLTTITLLALAKRFANSPSDVLGQMQRLIQLSRHYQQQVIELSNRLDALKKIESKLMISAECMKIGFEDSPIGVGTI